MNTQSIKFYGVNSLYCDFIHWLPNTLSTLRQRLAIWNQRIIDRSRLSRTNDRQLRDIGLTRTEAQYLSEKPFWKF